MNKGQKFSAELSLLITASLIGDTSLVSYEKPFQVDRERLMRLAEWHQVSSLLHDYLMTDERFEGLVGRENMGDLKLRSVNGTVYNMLFLKKSLEFHADLHANGVPAFLMKGALWAWWLYDKPGLREFGDIDFFVPKEDVFKSLEVLKLHGYYADAYRKVLLKNEKVARLYFDTDYQLPLEPDQEQIVRSMEIQWNTTYPRFAYSFTCEELMSRSMTFEVLEYAFEIPSAEHQLIMMLIHHAGVEQWDKLKYMGDFVRLLRKCSGELDWQYVQTLTKDKGCYRLLLESLGLVKVLTGEDYGSFINDTSFDRFPSDRLRSSVFSHWENSRVKPATKSWQIFSYNMQYRDRPGDKLSILFKHLAYLLEWRLLIPKARWYMKRG